MVKYMLSTILLVFITMVWFANGAAWSYTNPSSGPYKWGKHFSTCRGWKQSPINIPTTKTTSNQNLRPVRMFLKKGIQINKQKFKVSNNGHSVSIGFPKDIFFISFMHNNTEQYSVDSMHFHWGWNDFTGSEHAIDGQRTAMESHIVSYNKMAYTTFAEAAGKPNGLAVLGFLLDVRKYAREQATQLALLGDLMKVLPKLTKPQTSLSIVGFDLTKVMTQVNPRFYFRYEGSLTTPPCTENVLWTVFRTQVPLLPKQLSDFRKLKYPAGEKQKEMYNNVRPLQMQDPANTLAGRIIYRSVL